MFNYKDKQKPNYVKTTARTRHVNDELAAFPPLGGTEGGLISYTYTGGLGQEIMTKVQAEDGDVNGLPTTNRWTGTGRTVLNNKGKVVKQYEPYFSDTYDYESEEDMPAYGVTPIMHYDSLGRLIRTDLPDGTFTKVEFTPWQVKNYDTNDTVWDSQWLRDNSPFEGGQGDVLAGDPVANPTGIQRAALLTIEHANTPQTVTFDVLGREFLTEDDNATEGKYTVRNQLDITGNITSVTDAKGREMTMHKYDMAGRLLRTYNIDSGTRIMLPDAADKPLRQADSRAHLLSFEYDALQRPKSTDLLSSAGQSSVKILKTEYGQKNTDDISKNLNGQARKSYDQSGITTVIEYDFKGNPLQTQKQFAQDYQNNLDWESTVNMLTAVHTNSLLYDALNRPIKQTKPDNSIIINQYNKAGLLEKVQTQHSASPGTFTDYVTNINYNEKAQRTKIEYGNGTQTTYEYYPNNFRLKKIITTRSTDTLQNISYIYDPEGNITEINDTAQQTIYFNGSVVEPKSLYEYDALYRLKKATGREHNSLANLTENDFVNNIIRPEDGTNMRNYTQEYQYDEIGNLLQMKSNGVWTREYKYNFDVDPNNNNYLLNHDSQSTTDTYLYDAHGNMTKMPHLQELFWDYADNLKEVTLDASNNKAYYVYDANGDRVRKVVVKNTGTIVEDRFYIGDYEIYSKKTNGTLDTERETLHIIDDKSKLALIDYDTQNSTTTIRYQYTNHLDSASLELDETGDIISYEEYHPFGTTSYRSGRSEIDVSLKRYKYVHKELDNETGLYYYGMRYYAPWIARFISVDPLQFKYPIYTPYQYAGNKPISNIDLDGAEELNKVEPNVPPGTYERLMNLEANREEGTKRTVKDDYGSFTMDANEYWHKGSEGSKAGWYRIGDYAKINDVEDFAFNLARTYRDITPTTFHEIYEMTYGEFVENAQNKLLELSEKYNYSDTFFQIIADNYDSFVSGYKKWHGEALSEVNMLDIVLTVTAGGAIIKGFYKAAINQALKRRLKKNLTKEITEEVIEKEMKFVPNPFGRHGSPEHVGRILQAEERLSNMSHLQHISGGSLPELKFGSRYPDLVFKNLKTGKYIALQVGRTTKGGLPVMRERLAILDLIKTNKFEHVYFLKY